jgi:hypothetical protein
MPKKMAIPRAGSSCFIAIVFLKKKLFEMEYGKVSWYSKLPEYTALNNVIFN